MENYKDMLSSAGESKAKKVFFNTTSSENYLTNEAYKTLRTNILFCGSDIKTIVITSCNENEGKSTISTELSKSLAESGKRTLLIDADMRKSVMLKNRKQKEITGLSEVLSGQTSASEVIFSTQDSRFDVMFTGHFPPNPVELLGGTKLKEMLSELSKVYDYIIIDSPPLEPVIDAAVIAAVCDGAIMVIARHKVSRKVAMNVKEQLQKSGTRILGAVVNEICRPSYASGYYYKKKKSSYYTSD